MDTSPEKYMDRLIEISNKKQELLQNILALTKAQAGTINEDGIESLQKLIDEKQLVIDAINKLDEEFGVYFQRLKTTLKVTSLDQLNVSGIKGTKELKEVTEKIVKLITEISEIEKQNSEKGKKLLNQLGGEIRKINQGKKTNSAYSPPPMSIPSYFIDKKK
jgi:hypothetical protein